MPFESVAFDSVRDKKNGVKVSNLKKNGEEVPKTVQTLTELKETILPYQVLGFRFRAVNIFWYNLETKCEFVDSFTPHRTLDGDLDGDLPVARPPDPFLLPIWRLCHMGIILEAHMEDTKDSASLQVAIELMNDGIELKHCFGTSVTTKKKVVQDLRNSAPDKPVFSAGVQREIDVPLDEVLKIVAAFKTTNYSLGGFNCQHFSSIMYQNLTKVYLHEALRKRWTSNQSMWGLSKQVGDDTNNAMAWALASRLLIQELHPVEGTDYLYSRSPSAVGKATKGALGVAAVAGMKRMPVLAIAVTAGALIADLPQLRRFKRSTIWFKYDRDRQGWFWSPYREGEIDEEDRWTSVHTLTVQKGRFGGCDLEGTSRRVANVLANNPDLNPTVMEKSEEDNCPICLEPVSEVNFLHPKCCNQHLCTECFALLDRCPYCRETF